MNDFPEEMHPGSLESHTLYCRIKFSEFLSAIVDIDHEENKILNVDNEENEIINNDNERI